MKNHLNLIRKTNNSGFTLVELLLASVGMFFVVMAAGYGVFVMARENVAANAAGDTQYNLSRAVDFISEEIKSSANITADSSLTSLLSTCLAAGTGNEVGTGTATPVLGLSVNGSATTNVIYYTQKPSSTWLGNNAIYRCGPVLDSNGAYTSSIKSYLLVDLIASANAPNDTAGCSNGGTAYPNVTSGFFVCKNDKLAELHVASSALNAQTGKDSLKWVSSNSASRFNNKATYGIISQAYARAPGDLSVSVAPTTVTKASGTPLTYTFNRFEDATAASTINFSVGGTAVYPTDYAQSGAATFSATAGTITFAANSKTATLALTRTTSIATNKAIIITVTSNTGYSVGSANSATGSITVP
jgi:hypothetical protein